MKPKRHAHARMSARPVRMQRTKSSAPIAPAAYPQGSHIQERQVSTDTAAIFPGRNWQQFLTMPLQIDVRTHQTAFSIKVGPMLIWSILWLLSGHAPFSFGML